MADTDEKLMLAVRGGDVSRLGELFDRHHRPLFDFFARVTGSRAIADDLVQDVFFRMLKYRATFRGDSRFKAWMFHIAHNARIDHYKKHQMDALPQEEEPALRSRLPLPGEELEHEQQTILLECAMLQLPAEKREILVLSRYHDMKYDQIAEVMGCETGAVKVRVHRAINELRDIYLKLSKEKLPCNVKTREINSLIS
jgi:RNA polymerase sigma factor (sigma-70 family)